MKRLHINPLLTLVFIIFFLTPTSVKALETNNSLNKHWKILNSTDTVPQNKIWKIKFNKSLDINSIIKDNIYVTDNNNNVFPIKFTENQDDNMSINIAPEVNYNYGENYTLWIKNLKGKKGQTLAENTKMNFTIRQAPPKTNEVVVSNTKEFLENIDSNKTIILKSGNYNLLDTPMLNNKHIEFEEVIDGYQLVIKNIYNLNIKGEAAGKVNLLVHPRYANVLSFRNCNNINISNIIAGHYPDEGECTGGVLAFDDSNNINIDNSELFGCGTEGLTLANIKDLTFTNSTIRDCSYGIMSLYSCKDIKFNNSQFYNNRRYDLININYCPNVKFDNCNIYNNSAKLAYNDIYHYLFSLNGSNVILNNCNIYNNTVHCLVNDSYNLTLNNVNFKNNDFD